MTHEAFYEITRRSIPLTKYDGLYLSWRDSVINVRTDKGMNFIEFSHNLECLDKVIDLVEHSIPSPKNSPAAAICKSNFIYSEMKNYDYTEMIVDSSFWPHNNNLTQEMTTVVMSTWSPPNFIKNKSVLALLNNIGGVDIIMQQQHQWKSILNMCPYIEQNLEYNKIPKNFDALKRSVYVVETSSICWAASLNSDHSCYFVTAQKNGIVLFWQILNNLHEPKMIGQIDSNMSEIKNIVWLPQTGNKFCLVCADILGQVNAFVLQINDECISLLDSHVVWQHKDRMIASHLNYIFTEKNIILFYSKHRHFVVQLLDEKCNVLSQYLNNINDYRITDIISSRDGYYLATINVKIFKVNIKSVDTTINVDLIPVEFKEPYACTYELYSLAFSSTSTLCVLGMLDRKLLCRKKILKIELFFLTTESKFDTVFDTIVNNPTKKLTDYWDCIEAVRYKINKMKKMPHIDFNSMYTEASNDIYKLKLYLIILIFFTNMKKQALISSESTLPELSVETVKEKILLLHAQSTIETLYNKFQKKGKLDDLEHETLFGCVNYLEFYSKKYKTEIVLDTETSSIVKHDFKYICQCCDDNIKMFTCKSGHVNMFCMQSFTPIDGDDYLVCKGCTSTARTDICKYNALCVFCDLHLVRPD